MTIQNFLDQIFNKIQEAVPSARIEYQFKPISNTHFIKVTPLTAFKEEAFVDIDFEFSAKFYEFDFNSDLCFLTEDSLVDLDNPSIDIAPKIIDASQNIYLVKHDIFASGFLEQVAFQRLANELPFEVEKDDNSYLAMAA